ncbi:MAG: T9SS type A sorting domain-containing protein, partial [Ignavibacteria bacterium]
QDTIEQYFDRAYNSLLNVGVETKMYFVGHLDGSALTGPAWTVFIRPIGSVADFGVTKDLDSATQINTFIPDVVGTYKIAFSDGVMADTLVINAATYLGVEGGAGSNCIGCHNTSIWDYKYDQWLETGHSDMLVRGLNGTLSSHYGENCVSCHTVGYDPDANNGGFDDFPFVFPDSLYPGVYDLTMAAYPDAMARANIQCESCHGPGSAHLGVISNSKISTSIRTENCAWCHDDGHFHVFPTQWELSGEDATEFDGRGFHGGHGKGAFTGYAGGRAGCAPCHSGAGYIQWVNEGRPVDQNGLPASIGTVPEVTLITCATCHDPHDATNEHQVRLANTNLGDGTPVTVEEYGTGTLCMHCHRSRRNADTYASDPDNASSHFGAHHGPEADLLLGVNYPTFYDDLGNPIVFSSSPHDVAVLPGETQGNACVNCHMAGDIRDAEGHINHVGGHTWNMNDAEGNDHVEACAPCHGDVGTSFKDKKYYLNGNADLDGDGVAEGLQIEIKNLLERLALLLPPVGENEVAVLPSDTTLTPGITKAAYVYFWIEEDRSFGIHNPAFAFSILKAAIEEVGGVVTSAYPEGEIPDEFQLSQNYPNPFNPSTTIEFVVPTQSNVKVVVFDALGKQLDILFDGFADAGNHTITWNAGNYASGIYFYRMESDNFVQVKKMLLMK